MYTIMLTAKVSIRLMDNVFWADSASFQAVSTIPTFSLISSKFAFAKVVLFGWFYCHRFFLFILIYTQRQ